MGVNTSMPLRLAHARARVARRLAARIAVDLNVDRCRVAVEARGRNLAVEQTEEGRAHTSPTPNRSPADRRE
jgi:hypothetical protein